ncbi:MAG: hypothetical protein LUQ69_01165 [Methanoregulaceae archaeon]|nr:hypothetical protein [Methanoregulaceae archaeon]
MNLSLIALPFYWIMQRELSFSGLLPFRSFPVAKDLIQEIWSAPKTVVSFPNDRAAPPCTPGFASQKRTLAFYTSKDIAPFAMNPKEIAYLKKVCESVRFFAGM